MLTEKTIRQILKQLPQCAITVVGDFFLDKYLEIDGQLTEKSVETGLDAYQVIAMGTSPGAGGTVTNNLAALGVGQIYALTLIGSDGDGFELRRELKLRGVDLTHAIDAKGRFTPTYTKPMLKDGSGPARELNRLDIKNRGPTPANLIQDVVQRLDRLVAECHAVIVADQVSEPECGVITGAVRERLATLGMRYPHKILFADSRDRIGLYRNVVVKPNQRECLRAVGASLEGAIDSSTLETAALQLAARTGRPVYCTLGDQGTLYCDADRVVPVASFPVAGPIDIVGAGDSATAGIVCALCAHADPLDAAALGNLVASITIQQIGTTGTATPQQVLARWHDVAG